MSQIAFVGSNNRLKLFFKLTGISCFNNLKEVNPEIFSIVLVQEELFYKLNLKEYFGKLLIMPFKNTKKPLQKKLWFEKMIMGEVTT